MSRFQKALLTSLAAFGLLLPTHGFSQETPESQPRISESWSAGFSFFEVSEEDGLGVSVTSPSFIQKRGSLRASYTQVFKEAIPSGATSYDDLSYALIGLEWLMFLRSPEEAMRPYWGAGAFFAITDEDILDDGPAFPFNGLVGFEFGPAERTGFASSWAAFFEFGYMYNVKRAEALPGDPRFASGFTNRGGIKFYY